MMAKRNMLKNFNQETRLYHQRLFVAAVLLGTLSLLLITRLAYLQLVQHNLYTTLSIKNQLALIPLEPNRGLIYDRNGVLLAENKPVFSLDIVPAHVAKMPETLAKLQAMFHLPDSALHAFRRHQRQHRAFEPIPIKMKLSPAEVALFYVNQHRLTGVQVNARMLRHYPEGKETVSVVGFVGRINEHDQAMVESSNYSATNYIGKIGIERYYERELHGEVGYKQVEVSATGQVVRTLKEMAPLPGNNLYLSIDSTLQKAAHKALAGERGAVVAIEPATGQVLCLASHPSYDPNQFITGMTQGDYQKLESSNDKPMYNRAIRGQYPLASTIKPFMGLEGLQSGLVTPKTQIYDRGHFSIPYNKHVYRDWNPGGHGFVNLRKALIVSCDTYFYELALQLGIDRIDEIMSKFGFGQHTGVDLSEELPGILPSPAWKKKYHHENWYTGDTIISGIGQGFFLTTPIQLASSIATIANRGLRFQPQLLHHQILPNQQIIPMTPIAQEAVQLDDESYWDEVIDDMVAVIESTHPKGTGFRFGRHAPYTTAAKTGTAQFTKPAAFENKHDAAIPKEYRDHSLFIAFAPVKNPKIAVAVVVENNKIAPKIARKVIDAYLMPKTKIAVTPAKAKELAT